MRVEKLLTNENEQNEKSEKGLNVLTFLKIRRNQLFLWKIVKDCQHDSCKTEIKKRVHERRAYLGSAITSVTDYMRLITPIKHQTLMKCDPSLTI